MAAPFEEILRKMGWTDGFKIPVANKENKELEAEVGRLMLQKAKATVALDNANSRFEALQKHMKYVNQENIQNQSLMTAHMQQLKNEDHKLQLTKSEKAKTEQDIRKTTKTFEDIEERNKIKQNDLDRGLAKLDKMKTEMTWDEEALKAWDESLRKRDEDNELLKKFTQEDERRLKELEAKRQCVQTQYETRKKSIAKMVTDVVNYEQIIERTAKVFKQQKTEREALVKQWREAIRNLRQRDDAIDKANFELATTRDLMSKKKEELDEQNQFLLNEMNNNKELEGQIEEANLLNSKTRQELNELVQYVLTLSSELNVLKRTVTTTANYLEKERINGRNLDKTLIHREYQIDELEKTLTELQKKYEETKNTSMTSSERIRRMEKIIEYEQQQMNMLMQETERLQGILFRSTQILNELKETAKANDLEIDNFETQTNLLRRQAKNIYNELQKQIEIIYDFEYRKDQMEEKLLKLEGTSNDEEIDALKKRIQELEQIYSKHLEVKNLLQHQVTRIEDEMRRLSTTISMDKAQMEISDSKLKEQILFFECCRKQCAAAKMTAQLRQVEENVLRLKVNQLEKAMKNEDSKIYTLQRYRLELETATRERQIEINANKEILMAKRRNLSEEKGRLKSDIVLRHIRIDQWQKKYHIAMMALGKGDDGQPLSVTDFKIKNAQEKYMLQQEGDELDEKIRKAEKEIIAMENTLKVVNMTNRTYKLNLSAIDEEGDEVKEMKELENNIRDENLTLRKLKRELDNKKTLTEERLKMYEELEKEKEKIEEQISEKEHEFINVSHNEYDKTMKIDRVDKNLKTLYKKISDAKVSTDKYERDLEIRLLQDVNKNALRQLSKMTIQYLEASSLIIRYAVEYSIDLPSPKMQYTPSLSTESTRTLSSSKSKEVVDFDYQGVSNIVLELNLGGATSGKTKTKRSK